MKTLIGIPCMDMVHTGFMKSLLQLQRKEEVGFSIISSSLIYDARNTLAKHGIDGGFDRILWLDSDMEFSPDLLNRLIDDMDENDLDIVGGIDFTRKTPSMPCFYQKVGYLHDEEEDSVSPVALHYYDYPADQLFTVEGLGFGAVLVKVDLIKKVQDKYGLPFSPILASERTSRSASGRGTSGRPSGWTRALSAATSDRSSTPRKDMHDRQTRQRGNDKWQCSTS